MQLFIILRNVILAIKWLNWHTCHMRDFHLPNFCESRFRWALQACPLAQLRIWATLVGFTLNYTTSCNKITHYLMLLTSYCPVSGWFSLKFINLKKKRLNVASNVIENLTLLGNVTESETLLQSLNTRHLMNYLNALCCIGKHNLICCLLTTMGIIIYTASYNLYGCIYIEHIYYEFNQFESRALINVYCILMCGIEVLT